MNLSPRDVALVISVVLNGVMLWLVLWSRDEVKAANQRATIIANLNGNKR